MFSKAYKCPYSGKGDQSPISQMWTRHVVWLLSEGHPVAFRHPSSGAQHIVALSGMQNVFLA